MMTKDIPCIYCNMLNSVEAHADSFLCGDCGRLQMRCPAVNCQRFNQAGSLFCGHCGEPLDLLPANSTSSIESTFNIIPAYECSFPEGREIRQLLPHKNPADGSSMLFGMFFCIADPEGEELRITRVFNNDDTLNGSTASSQAPPDCIVFQASPLRMPLYDTKGRIPMAGIAHLFMYWNGHAIQACALEESDMSNSVIERTVMPCREKPSAIIGLPLNGELYSAIVFKRRLLLQSVGDISKSFIHGSIVEPLEIPFDINADDRLRVPVAFNNFLYLSSCRGRFFKIQLNPKGQRITEYPLSRAHLLLSSPVLLKNDYGSGGIYMEYLDVKCGQRGGVTFLPDRDAFIIPAAEEDPFAGERAIKDPEEAALDFLSDDRRPLVLVSNNRDFGVFFSQSIVSMSFFLTDPAGVPKRGNFQDSAAIPSVVLDSRDFVSTGKRLLYVKQDYLYAVDCLDGRTLAFNKQFQLGSDQGYTKVHRFGTVSYIQFRNSILIKKDTI